MGCGLGSFREIVLAKCLALGVCLGSFRDLSLA